MAPCRLADTGLRAARVLAFLWLIVPAAAPASSPRIATLDWTLAETLLALGVTPAAVAQVDAYDAWVREPELPADVVDLGLRTQPNLELLADLEPDRILISPMFANLEPRLRRIAPVDILSLYTPETDTWAEMLSLTRELGRLAGREAAAEQLIADTQARIEALGDRVDDISTPLLLVQFMDARHVRVFGDNGLYQAVLDQLGLDNGWPGTTNYWGFATAGLEELAGIDARLVVVRPYPAGVEERLESSGLWQALPSVRRGTTITLPPVWSFGALPSARRFAEALVTALEEADA
ncbi:ABC transporter substrate-binding protein [Aquisalimonas lutea]|uniref:ABC transporter substrate-binding protein n=1 Tax=Aquisalimonas lutea TaxID=1327750 RepID=UPI0025B2EEE2|nr:ABC transporter substrate-binding protein [Aquisalimonas lutea]MDN3516844.1 ABC transporter substrate-binding protein [Aquisalimonas lutea]